MKKLNLKNSSLLTTAIVLASTATAGYIIYYLIKKWKSKNKKIYKQRPFSINTLNRQYIGFTKDLQSEWKGKFTFVQCADTQFGLIDRYVYKLPEINWNKEINYLKLTIQSVNSLNPKPKFFIICGDLVDAFPNQIKLRNEQISDLKQVLQELHSDIKIVCVCGNHDIGDIPTNETIQLYTSDFGDDYFSFWCNGCKFITLNSQFFFNSLKVPDLKQMQEEWLDSELVKEDWKHLMMFQHIPWFLSRPNEPADPYFNIEPVQRLKWLKKFKEAGVSKIFCGHYHQNTGGFYDNDLEVIVTTAVGAQLGPDKHGYRLVEVDENYIKHSFIPVSDKVN